MTTLASNQPAAASAFYGACQECTAKWFSPIERGHCPRCGSRAVLLDRQKPPWTPEEPNPKTDCGFDISHAAYEKAPEIIFDGDTTMTNKPNGPVQEYRAGSMKAAIWEREQERDGRTVITHNVTLQKQYFDRQSREWRDSNVFFPDELPRLRLLIDKAFEYVTLREGRSEACEAGGS